MSQWISVKDRLPEQKGDYLCVCESGEISVGYFSKWIIGYGFETQEVGQGLVTHWMPLPDPPEGEE